MTINYQTVIGQTFADYIGIVANMRIKVFYEYPYLYKGSIENENDYLKTYVNNPQSTLVLAKDDEKIIGLSTGIPLASETSLLQACQHQLLEMKIDIQACYYYGEVIVDSAYQGQGISKTLYAQQDTKVKSMEFDKILILTVIRPEHHPLKPINYKNTDTLWPHFGFKKTPITITYPWPTRQTDGSIKTEQNGLQLWIKEL